ncbi:MAG: NADP-dependent oxidoreductase [Candidatus Thiodiazotropha sp.]|jgi:NADPH:quinone reductase-like Zn-dependent oxidoreductase
MSATNEAQMRAVRIHNYGGQEQMELESIAVPKPTADEVLIKVHAAGVNPVDWKIREGYLAENIPHTLPLTLGWDFAGEVSAVGQNVKKWRVGDAVYARPDLSKDGAYAEYITVSADEIAAKPKTLSWQKSAAVPLVTLTAWQALNDIGQMKQGDRVLIHAGAGGVGIAAIQLAKQAGATVYTTASTRNVEFLKSLGADEVIDYSQHDFSKLAELDIVFDTLGGEVLEKSWVTLKKGGRLISIAEIPNEELAAKHEVSANFCFVQANSGQLSEICNLIDSGDIKVEVDSVFRLDDIAKAHEKSESGHTRGKIVIQVQEED